MKKKKKSIRQFALPLAFRKVRNKNNFILNDSNKFALSLVDKFRDVKNFKEKYNFPILIIYGPKGCGKSHLANVYSEITKGEFISKLDNKIINQAKLGRSFIIDDFDKLSNLDENLFIHFFNEITFNLGSLLIVTTQPPSSIKFKLSDLRSRIKSCVSAKIDLPNDEVLYSILVKELSEKKLFLDDKLCIYVIKRVKRNYNTILEFSDRLDKCSLEKKNKINLKDLKEIINDLNIES